MRDTPVAVARLFILAEAALSARSEWVDNVFNPRLENDPTLIGLVDPTLDNLFPRNRAHRSF